MMINIQLSPVKRSAVRQQHALEVNVPGVRRRLFHGAVRTLYPDQTHKHDPLTLLNHHYLAV